MSFYYKNDKLFCEDVSLETIVEGVGTPFYLYSYEDLVDSFTSFDGVFQDIPHLICYAVKANSNLAILRTFALTGGGADIVSGGELRLALQAGIAPEKIVFAGVGKRKDEIRETLEADILMFNVESLPELEIINRIGDELKRKARIAFRVNLDIDPGTHPYISTGLRGSKFGLSIEEALEGYHRAKEMANVTIIGIHTHLGSQITHLEPFTQALEGLIKLTRDLSKEGINIHYLDIGGGLGITYLDETPPTPDELAQAIIPTLQGSDLDVELIIEPGRALVGKAGVLVTQVLYIKKTRGKNFVIVDAGMNDLIRPSLYGAYHEVRQVKKRNDETFIADVVGPVCESADFLAKDLELAVKVGDLLAIMDVGAYGFSMSSNYNSRLRVPEVLVQGDKYFIIRERENYQDLWRNEQLPPFLKQETRSKLQDPQKG